MLLAAGDILAKGDLSTLTLRACARAAGVSHAAPAHHFGDMRGLLTALATESFTMLGDLTETVRKDGKLPGLYGALGRAYVEFASHNPGRFRLMMRHDIVNFNDPEFNAAAHRCFASMTNIISVARGDEETTLDELIAAGDPAPLARDVILTWSLIHGFAHLRIEGNFDIFAEHMGGDDMFDDACWADIGERIGALISPV